MASPLRRRAVRVVCREPGGRVLLMSWRDPVTGRVFFEPPGGGVEPGETELDAARRELLEETGLVVDLDEGRAVEVERDFEWCGSRIVGPERFYGTVVDGAAAVVTAGFTASEVSTFAGSVWVLVDELRGLPGAVEPPELGAVVEALFSSAAPCHRHIPPW